MARLDWRKASLAGKPTLSLKNEKEFLEKSYTSRWLERVEKWQAANRRASRKAKR
jgi:hypothetical protein